MTAPRLYVLQYHDGAAWIDVDGIARPYGEISHYAAPAGSCTRLRRA